MNTPRARHFAIAPHELDAGPERAPCRGDQRGRREPYGRDALRRQDSAAGLSRRCARQPPRPAAGLQAVLLGRPLCAGRLRRRATSTSRCALIEALATAASRTVLRVRTELPLQEAASDYERRLGVAAGIAERADRAWACWDSAPTATRPRCSMRLSSSRRTRPAGDRRAAAGRYCRASA